MKYEITRSTLALDPLGASCLAYLSAWYKRHGKEAAHSFIIRRALAVLLAEIEKVNRKHPEVIEWEVSEVIEHSRGCSLTPQDITGLPADQPLPTWKALLADADKRRRDELYHPDGRLRLEPFNPDAWRMRGGRH